MNLLLFVVSVALAGIAALLCRSWEGRDRNSGPSLLTLALLGGVGFVACRWLPEVDRFPTGLAFLLGIACSALSLLFSRGDATALAVGVVGGAASHFIHPGNYESIGMAVVAGAGLGLAVTRNIGGTLMAAALAVVILADILGSQTDAPESASLAGTAIGLVTVLVFLLARLLQSRPALIAPVVATLIGAASFAIGKYWLRADGTPFAGLLGAAVGLVVHWLIADNSKLDPLRTTLAALLWVSLATLGFSFAKGFGMSLSLVSGALVLAGLGNVRGLLTSGPLLGLVCYRVFREAHVDASRAMDLGQHYALIGLLFGAILPLAPWDAVLDESKKWRFAATGALWAVLLAIVPGLVPVLLDAKGAVGFVAGLGIAPLLSARDETSRAGVYGFAAGLAGVSVIAFGQLQQMVDLTRDDKTKVLMWSAAAIALLAAVLFAVTPRKVVENAS